jgi:glycosyltransferase involved in cell wall biosynthesis
MPSRSETNPPRVLLVAENASAKFGGEAILPIHYFRLLRQRGIEVWLVVNQRTKHELAPLFADEQHRIHFVPDTKFRQFLEKIARPFPAAVKHFTFRLWGRLLSGIRARRIVRRLVKEHQIDIVHQPTPVSPKEASLIFHVGAPVIIGPMNGGITYPPGFANFQNRWVRSFIGAGRTASHLLNRLAPGKLRAKTLLVANPRTAAALPNGVHGEIQTLVENAVDLTLWRPGDRALHTGEPTKFIFSGRLVDWKGVQYLIDAFAAISQKLPATLDILGNGPMRSQLEKKVADANLNTTVKFHGWLPQPDCAALLNSADIFVLPSLYECGGAVVLEAMATGLPVIATNWGGPADYLDPSCGLLVEPESPSALVTNLTNAMLKLATDSSLARQMGATGRSKVERDFDWQRKIDQILQVYSDTIQRSRSATGV